MHFGGWDLGRNSGSWSCEIPSVLVKKEQAFEMLGWLAPCGDGGRKQRMLEVTRLRQQQGKA